MNTLEKKQLNLLTHLAKIDGRFAKSEQELLHKFMEEKKMQSGEPEEEHPIRFSDFVYDDNRVELLHWAIQVMHADQIVHPKEVIFCKNLAVKLGFKEEIIDFYINNPLPELKEFEEETKKFLA